VRERRITHLLRRCTGRSGWRLFGRVPGGSGYGPWRASFDGVPLVPQNALVPTILIQLPGGEGIVRRDDREIVITPDVGGDWSQRLRRHTLTGQ
jgi:hypothetical protein